jgi:hypothetical protein
VSDDAKVVSSATKTGALIPFGMLKLGTQMHHYWRCVDCKTDFAGSQCNGHVVKLCPWCRPDSKAWTNGRGL